jgi:hypothetical protein
MVIRDAMSRIRRFGRQFADERSRGRTYDPRADNDADRMISGGFAFVAVVQAADFGKLDDLAQARWLHGSRIRGVLAQGEVGPLPVIVRNIPA